MLERPRSARDREEHLAALQKKLWDISLELAKDEDTRRVASALEQRAHRETTAAPA